MSYIPPSLGLTSYEFQKTPSSSSSSSSSCENRDESATIFPLSKRNKDVAISVQNYLNLASLPDVLKLEIFTYFSFEELSLARGTSRWINNPISVRATTRYTFIQIQINFTNQVFAKCMKRTIASKLCEIDLSKTSVSHLKQFLNQPMPALTTLKFPQLRGGENPLDLGGELDLTIPDLLSAHCMNLTALDFNERVEAIDTLSRLVLPKLRDLNLDGGWSVSRPEMDLLARNSPNLKKLSLKNSEGDHVLASLRFPELEELNLQDSEFLLEWETEEQQEEVSTLSKNCPKLTSLNIPGPQLDNAFLDLSKLNFPALQHLNISCWTLQGESFEREGFVSLFAQCPLLRSLNFSACIGIQRKHLSTLSSLSNLTALNMETCHVTNREFVQISRSCPELTSLNLCEADALTIRGVKWAQFPKLTHLNLADCHDISNKSLVYLSLNCPLLKELDLSLTSNKVKRSGRGIEGLILPRLTSLNIAGNQTLPNFDYKFLRLRGNCPNLTNLTLLNLNQ